MGGACSSFLAISATGGAQLYSARVKQPTGLWRKRSSPMKTLFALVALTALSSTAQTDSTCNFRFRLRKMQAVVQAGGVTLVCNYNLSTSRANPSQEGPAIWNYNCQEYGLGGTKKGLLVVSPQGVAEQFPANLTLSG